MPTITVVESFKYFQKEAREDYLYPFTERVSVKSITLNDASSVYPPWCFDFFEEMLKQMSQKERIKYCFYLSRLYKRLLRKFCRVSPHRREMVPFLRRTFTPLFGLKRSFSSDEALYLVARCVTILNVSYSDLLGIVPRGEDTAFLLQFKCFDPNGWSIQNNRALMLALESKEDKRSSVPLIQYGFQYLFDKNYFIACAVQLLDGCGKIKEKNLCSEFNPNILSFSKGNMRLQLALELLVTLFDDNEKVDAEMKLTNKNILGLLWRAVPFPYISSSEMFTVLEPFYKGEHLELQEVCDEFKKHNKLFEVPDVSEPRSLQHLSKIQIRKSLCDAKTISDETIDSFDIPWPLKDYLKLPFYKYYS